VSDKAVELDKELKEHPLISRNGTVNTKQQRLFVHSSSHPSVVAKTAGDIKHMKNVTNKKCSDAFHPTATGTTHEEPIPVDRS